jgi:hypothetical protein
MWYICRLGIMWYRQCIKWPHLAEIEPVGVNSVRKHKSDRKTKIRPPELYEFRWESWQRRSTILFKQRHQLFHKSSVTPKSYYKILQQRNNGNKSRTIWRNNCVRYIVMVIVLACTCMSALYEFSCTWLPSVGWLIKAGYGIACETWVIPVFSEAVCCQK